jgi:CDP-diacylglycerol--glycerol-3-phosphate 3-phosphatidyltransferase
MASGPPTRSSLVLPEGACAAVIRVLDRVSERLVVLGVSANAVTSVSVVIGAIGGVLLAFGEFGLAACAMIAASMGDALDGLVARRSRSVSVAGALLDASGDRYQEFFFLGGLAVYFRTSAPMLVVTLLALVGSFMVSYSSAKAEALGVPVPPGVMRRPERAVCLCVGATLTAPWMLVSHALGVARWADAMPAAVAVSLIAVVGNASAVRRLRTLAQSPTPRVLQLGPRPGLTELLRRD